MSKEKTNKEINEEVEESRNKPAVIVAVLVFLSLIAFAVIGGVILIYININVNTNALNKAKEEYMSLMKNVYISETDKQEYDSLISQLEAAIDKEKVSDGKAIVGSLDTLVIDVVKKSKQIEEIVPVYNGYEEAFKEYIFSNNDKKSYNENIDKLELAIKEVNIESAQQAISDMTSLGESLKASSSKKVSELYNQLIKADLTTITSSEKKSLNTYKNDAKYYIDNAQYLSADKELEKWQEIVLIVEERNILMSMPGYGKTVVIDAGHQEKGNSEDEPIGPGATETKDKVAQGTTGVATGIPEYKLTLDVAIILREELEARGYNVIMIRESHDVNISNAKRAEIANNSNADAFIRIHANGDDNQDVSGILTICPTKNNTYCSNIYSSSRKLSDCVVTEMVKAAGANNKGVLETDDMSGINWCKVPVTIVEMGFMSNPEEDKLMASDEYRAKLVKGMAEGIDKYFSEN